MQIQARPSDGTCLFYFVGLQRRVPLTGIASLKLAPYSRRSAFDAAMIADGTLAMSRAQLAHGPPLIAAAVFHARQLQRGTLPVVPLVPCLPNVSVAQAPPPRTSALHL